jgi:hypothetical protein
VSGTIHVSCGHFALGEALSISSKDTVSLRDNLSFGPLGALNELESWWTMRQTYWEHVEREPRQTRNRRRRAKNADRDYIVGSLDRLANADEVVLWLGTGLAEQLALAWIPQLLRVIGGRADSMRIVQFDRTLGGAAIPTISVLSGAELRNGPTPRPVDIEGVDYLGNAWTALTESEPVALTSFIDNVPSPFPVLRAALERIFWLYPDFRSGINCYEARLLASTRDSGPTAARVIAASMDSISLEENERVGDIWLFWRLRRLADPTLHHPAVELTGARTTIRGTEARLTSDGERYLKAELNFVELNRIQDWVGGVHLDSRVGNVWFHQDKKVLRG